MSNWKTASRQFNLTRRVRSKPDEFRVPAFPGRPQRRVPDPALVHFAEYEAKMQAYRESIRHDQPAPEGRDFRPAELLLAIQELLAANGLPYTDIGLEDLQSFLGVWDNRRLVGVVGLQLFGDVALLRSLAVTPEYRHQGLGAHLTLSAEHEAWRQGVRRLYLLTTTAELFFQRFDYHALPRDDVPDAIRATAEFRDLCPSTAVVMVKQNPDLPYGV